MRPGQIAPGTEPGVPRFAVRCQGNWITYVLDRKAIYNRNRKMLKALLWIVIIIFVIGVLVVWGVLDLIF